MTNSFSINAAILLVALLAVLSPGTGGAAPGQVNSLLKIADGLSGIPNGTISIRDSFGSSCTVLGDLDGDGITEIAVGAFSDITVNGTRGGLNNGALHILFLKSDGSVKSHRKIADGLNGLPNGTIANNDLFGDSCTVLGDLDGDGIPEIAVGASGDNTANAGTGGINNGALYVLFLNRNGIVRSHRKIADGLSGIPEGTLVNGDSFGRSCTVLGDLDGDGIPEIAVGATGDDTVNGSTGGSGNGALYVLFLNADGSVKSHRKIADGINGLSNGTLLDGDRFGSSCTVPGDLDGDGIPEITVGAPEDDTVNGGTGGAFNGALYVLFLNADGSVKSHRKIADGLSGIPNGTIANDLFGESCTVLGDLDGDGIPEVAVGARNDPTANAGTGGLGNGALYVLFLNVDGSVRSHRKIADGLNGLPNGTLANADVFGTSCAVLGDLDGDSILEIAVGAAGDVTSNGSTGGSGNGAIYILSLGDLPITVTTAADEFNTPSGANLSLREAIRDAEATGEFRCIQFSRSLNGKTIVLSNAGDSNSNPDLNIISGQAVKITGKGLPDGITISGDRQHQIFDHTGKALSLECLTLENGFNGGSGGGVGMLTADALAVDQVTFRFCTSTSSAARGGAISAINFCKVTNSTFLNNDADEGGAISMVLSGGVLQVVNSTFIGNSATTLSDPNDGGGAILCSSSVTARINFCTFLENTAIRGGAVLSDNSTVTIRYPLYAGNGVNVESVNGGTVDEFEPRFPDFDDLAPLALYGGKTPTRPLLPSAIEKNTVPFLPLPTTDQNGLLRNRNGGTDPGAAEAIEIADFQPDNLIGEKAGKQKGNNLYNTSGAGQKIKVKLQGRKKFKTFMTVQNDGNVNDTITLRSSKTNKRTLKLKVIQLGGGNVTAGLLRGHPLPALAPGQSVAFRADYKAKSKTKKAKGNIAFSSTSFLFGKSDTVQAKVKSLRE